MLQEILVPLSAGFFAAEEGEDHSPFGPRLRGQSARQLQHGDTAGGVIVGPVVDGVALDRLAHAEVVEMGGEQDDFALELGITAFKNADDIAGRPVFGTFTETELAGNILNITAFVARPGNAQPL